MNSTSMVSMSGRWKKCNLIIVIFIVFFFEHGVYAMGEKNKQELNLLWIGIRSMLIDKKYCSSPEDCHKKLPLYGEGGDRVHLNIYSYSNKDIISSVMEFVSREGISITRGVPITVQVFAKDKSEYENSVGMIFVKPVIKLEVNQ